MAMRAGLGVIAVVAIAAGVWFLLGGAEQAPRTLAKPVGEPAAVVGDTASRPAPTSRATASAIVPNPLVDRAADAAAARAGRCEFRIVQPDGTPASAARCVLGRKRERLGFADCDANGVAAFTPSDGEAWLLVNPPARPRARYVVVPSAGRHVIDLPDGVAVRGHVVVDGRTPDEPIELRLSGAEVPLDGPVFEGSYLAAFGPDAPPTIRPWMCATTAPDGSFTFFGIPNSARQLHVDTVSDHFDVPPQVAARTHLANVIPLDPSIADNLVELTRMPVWTGRIVRPTGEPVADAVVSTTRISPTSRANLFRTKSDGRFSVPVNPPRVVGDGGQMRRDVKGFLWCAESPTSPVHQTTHGVDGARVRDVGDVVLPASARIALRLRDAAGAPIEGGRAVRPDGFNFPVQGLKSDGAGRLEISIDRFPSEVVVGAAGFHDQIVDIAGGTASPIEVTLVRGGHLDVDVRRRDGAPERRVTLELLGPRKAFESERLGIARFLASGFSTTPRDGKLSGEPDADGRLTFAGLVENSTYTVTASDSFGAVLATQEVTLTAESRPTALLTVALGSRKFACRVFDAKGVARKDASIRLSNPSFGGPYGLIGSGVNLTANDDGVYRASDISLDTVDLDVACPGCGRLFHAGIDLTGDDEIRDIHLSDPRTVVFEVVDPAGASVAFEQFEASFEGRPLGSGVTVKRREGKATVSGISAGKLKVRLRVARTDYDFEFDTSQPTRRIVLTNPGRVLVHVDPPVDREPGARWMIELVPEQGGARYSDLVARRASDPTDQLQFGSVLPGRYTARLVHLVANVSLGSSPPMTVDVESGKQAEVSVKRP